MKVTNILSADFPEISDAVKECVNRGQWLLFKSSSINDAEVHAAYYLKADAEIFELDNFGKILKSIPREGLNVRIDELCYFSDLPTPQSLSNMAMV